MAKKKQDKGRVDDDMNFDDLDDLGEADFGFEEELNGLDNREPSRSQVAKELVKDTASGFFDGLIKKTTKDALPEQYDASYYDAMDLANFGAEVVDRNKTKLNKSFFKLGKEVKRVLPFKLSMLDKYLETQEQNYETFKQQSEEEAQNVAIQSELTSIFDKQIEVQKNLEARREAQAEVDKKEQLVQGKMSQDILSNIDANVARQSSFTLEISKQYFRKSLELQFKSYFVQANMLKTMRESYKAFTVQFTNIEKNTSLPEFVKLKNTERLQDIVRTQATQSVYNQLFDNSKYMAGVKKRLSGFVDQKVNDVTDAVDNFSDMLGNLTGSAEATGQSSVGMVASVASSMLGGTLGEKAAGLIPASLKEKIKSNKAVNTGANYLNMLSNSPSTLIQTLRGKMSKVEENTEDESTPTRWLMNKASKGFGGLLDVAGGQEGVADVKQLGYLDHNKPAIFDNKVHRSISEVIPMYLARILKQNTDLSQMYYNVNAKRLGSRPDSTVLEYDFAKRSLSTSGDIRKSIESSLFSDKSTERRSKSISTSILSQSASGVNKLDLNPLDKKSLERSLKNKKSDKLLTSYIEQARQSSGVELSYDNLITNYEKNADLKALVDKNPELGDLISKLQKTKITQTAYVDSAMKDLRNQYPLEGVKRLFTESSRLAGSKTPHMITDATAGVFAKAFSTYIYVHGRDIVPSNVLTREAFSFIREDDLALKEISDSASILYADVKRIYGIDDLNATTSLDVLFGVMNTSLKQNINIDPSVYQTIAELYPEMVKNGKPSIENIAEGKFDRGEVPAYASTSQLKDLTKLAPDVLREKRLEVAAETILDKTIASARKRMQVTTNAIKQTGGNPILIAELFIKSAKSFKSSVSGALDANYNKLKGELNIALKNLSDFGNTTVKKNIPVVLSKLDSTIAGIDERIALIRKDQAERSEEIKEAMSNLANITTSISANSGIRGLDKAYMKYTDKEIKTLQEVRNQFYNLRVKISDKANETDGDIVNLTNFVVFLKQEFLSTVGKLKAQLEELEEEGKQFKLVTESPG